MKEGLHRARGSNDTFRVTATGTPAPTFFHTGTLPAGVTLSANGTLSGKPNVSGTLPRRFVITITATNGVGSPATQHFTLEVLGFHISTTSLPNGAPGHAYGPVQLHTLGGTGTIKWKKVSLPKGMKVSSTGVPGGMPNKKLSAGNYTVTISATEKIGKVKTTVSKSLVLHLT